MKKWLGIIFLVLAMTTIGVTLYLYAEQKLPTPPAVGQIPDSQLRTPRLYRDRPNSELNINNTPNRHPVPKKSGSGSLTASDEIPKQVRNDATKERNFQSKLYNLINAYRKERNLSPLLVSPQLELSAKLKLNDMVTNNYWQHQDNSNRPPWQFFAQAGYNYTKAGENLGFNQKSAFAVFDAWTKSKKHNEQLLTPEYEHMGLAVDCSLLKKADPNAGCIVVLHLGRL